MSLLFPTKTRLRRLRQVREGQIFRYGDGQDYQLVGEKVTAVMADLERAGWVKRADVWASGHKQPWLLTPLGERVLLRSEA